MPEIIFEDIEDYYTYFVLILKVSEDVFWHADYSFLLSIMANKTAFDNFILSEQQKFIKKKS